MAQFRIPAWVQHAKSSGESGGIGPASSTGECVAGPYVMNANGLAYTLRLPIPLDAVIDEARLFFINGGNVVATHVAKRDTAQWAFIAAATAGILANGFIVFSDQTGNQITVGGAAATATNVAGNSVQVVAKWRRGINGGISPGGADLPQAVTSLVGMFADDAQNDNPVTGTLLGMFAREERRLASQAGVTVIERAGVGPFTLPKCSMAYADPWGRVVMTTADLGAGLGQIPTDRTLWSAQQFLNQPQAFVRLADHVRGIGTARRRNPAIDAVPLQSGVAATMALYTVARAPLFSTWWCIIDGVSQEITFQHPAGSDLRRPADIWRELIVPYITAMGGVGGPGVVIPAGQTLPTIGTDAAVGPAITWTVDPGQGFFPVAAPVYPAPIFSQWGSLPRGFGFLSYARLLHLWDNQSPYGVTPILTPVPTTPEA